MTARRGADRRAMKGRVVKTTAPSLNFACFLLASPPSSLAWRAQPAPSGVEALPISFALGIENVELPGGEAMGLASGTLLFDVGGGWSWGRRCMARSPGNAAVSWSAALPRQRSFRR